MYTVKLPELNLSNELQWLILIWLLGMALFLYFYKPEPKDTRELKAENKKLEDKLKTNQIKWNKDIDDYNDLLSRFKRVEADYRGFIKIAAAEVAKRDAAIEDLYNNGIMKGKSDILNALLKFNMVIANHDGETLPYDLVNQSMSEVLDEFEKSELMKMIAKFETMKKEKSESNEPDFPNPVCHCKKYTEERQAIESSTNLAE